MPCFPAKSTFKPVQPPEMIRVEGGIVAMGSYELHQQPRLVQVDSFSIDPTCVTVGLQKEVFGVQQDWFGGQQVESLDDVVGGSVQDNWPASFSFPNNVLFCQKLSEMTGQAYGIGREAEWEYAARDRIDDVHQWMEEHPQLDLKSLADLQAWLVEGHGWLDNFVVLGRGEVLTLKSRLVTNPADSEFVKILESAARVGCWKVFSGERDAVFTQGIGSKLSEDGLRAMSACPSRSADRSTRGPMREPVKSGSPNQKGIWDMTGGSWEWCADVYREDAHCLPSNNPFNAQGSNDGSHRVLRGGFKFYKPKQCRIDAKLDNYFNLAVRLAGCQHLRGSESSGNFGARLFGAA